MIRSVAPNSDIAKSVRKGDVLLSIDGKPVHHDGSLSVEVHGHNFSFPLGAALAGKLPGDTAKLRLLRPPPAQPSEGIGGAKLPEPFDVDVALGVADPLIRRLAGNGGRP